MLRSIVLAFMMALVRADFSGVWKMTVATTPLRAIELPDQSSPGVTMELELQDAQTYKVVFHGGNQIMGGMTVEEELSDTSAIVAFSRFTSTRMMPPPAYRQAEAFIQSSIPLITTMQVNSDGDLILEGDNANLSAKFKPVAN
eukprot:CAMPEP_0119003100 /NCGR_PEP_ID=MMETSP1176-20130426/353_1 /TAXON_ID=265551 /ORGANISM="Synedropsis recta cf, Strain CCMP1620" /LENGTH=142 /DNA_ID=CAMNT_0006954667 /DNA_START=138 /DNA_END=566 /DNA_ORIENTATION=+